MKTTIWTAWEFKQARNVDDGAPRCIFNGEVPHLLRAGDQISILNGACIERIDSASYNIQHDSQEIHLVNSDYEKAYPDVDWR